MTAPNAIGNIGFANDRATTAPEHILGTILFANGTDYTYVSAASAIAAAGTFALSGTTTTSGTAFTHDLAAPGVAAGQYFWARKVASPL